MARDSLAAMPNAMSNSAAIAREAAFRVFSSFIRMTATSPCLSWMTKELIVMPSFCSRRISPTRCPRLEAAAAKEDLAADIIGFGDAKEIDSARRIFGRPRASQRNTTLEFDEQIGVHAYLDLLAFDIDRCIRIR